MKPKKPTKRKKDIVIKTDKSFEELIEGAFDDKNFKKRKVGLKVGVLTTILKKPRKK